MQSSPGLRDVARTAGVHVSTASRALNPSVRGRVSAETAMRVQKAAKKLGYVPNLLARGLKTNRSATIGVLISDLTNPLFPPIVRGIEDVLDGVGFTTLLANTDNDDSLEQRRYEALLRRGVDGFIVTTAHRQHPLFEQAAEAGVAMVLANRRTDSVAIPSVTSDDEAGTRSLVEHLVGLGHRRIAYVAGPQFLSTGYYRLQAFLAATRAAGLTIDDNLIVPCDSFREIEGERALVRLFETGSEFTAVIAANDLLALGCYDACRSAGVTCPDDLSIVGYNDMPFLDKLQPALTTVRIPHYDIGAESARLLLERLTSPDAPPKSLLLNPKLVVRGSTCAPTSTRQRS
ncbi:MAG: LacI family DNA-binding transcriptional regulator [Ilumatobacteraceae bacterium]